MHHKILAKIDVFHTETEEEKCCHYHLPEVTCDLDHREPAPVSSATLACAVPVSANRSCNSASHRVSTLLAALHAVLTPLHAHNVLLMRSILH